MRLLALAACAPLLLVLACSSSAGDAADGGAPSSTSGEGGGGGGGSGGGSGGGDSDGGGREGSSTTSLPSDGGAAPDHAAGEDGGAVNPLGLTKVLTGEYATHFLVKGQILTFSATPYEGVTGPGIPAVSIDVPAGTTFIDGQSGLHQSLAVDSTGHVWTWGDDVLGDEGNGQLDGATTGVLPYRIAQDANGADFGDVIAVTAGNEGAGETEVDGAVKSDGTVWVWGACQGGLLGNGVTTGGNVAAPTQVPIPLPSGVKITRFQLGSIGLALASDGSVWSWGGGGNSAALGRGSADDYATAQKIAALPSNIVDISLSSSFAYALTSDGDLYGWGYYGLNLGIGTWQADNPSCYAPTATPVLLTAGTSPVLPLPHPVAKIVTDAVSTHVILTDGSLWGWGDDSQGEVGDGQQLDYWTTKLPFAWDWGQCELMVVKPVQIAKTVTSPFVAIWSNSPAVFYTYAMTADGRLFSWGRNKTGNLGNGVVPPNTQQAAQYPDSWNVLVPTEVKPLSVTAVTPVNAPYCAKYPDAGDCSCPNGTIEGC